MFLLMHWSRSSSFCLPARESWNILEELRLEGISGNHPFQPSCPELTPAEFGIFQRVGTVQVPVFDQPNSKKKTLYIFVLSRISQISACALCLLLVTPISTGSGIVLDVTELGTRSCEPWRELRNILRSLLHTSSLVQPHSGIRRLWAWFLWLVWIEPALVFGFISFCLLCPAGVRGESWDLKAANSSSSLGPWFPKEHPLEGWLRSPCPAAGRKILSSSECSGVWCSRVQQPGSVCAV